MSDTIVQELDYDECLRLLQTHSVGRIAVVDNEYPVVLPVNYRLVRFATRVWIALRTRPGNIIDRAAMPAAFQIDGIDIEHHQGWSVLARGTLEHVNANAAAFAERFDPAPWLDGRDAWLVLEPFAVTGRRLRTETDWPFAAHAYL